jgi:hypothetical protein
MEGPLASAHLRVGVTIAGIPAHPLFVHAAVVLIPLTALLFIAWVPVPRWKQPFTAPTLLGAVVSIVVVFITRESGDALHGNPGMHETYADMFTVAVMAMVATIGGAYLMLPTQKWSRTLGWVERGRPVAAVAFSADQHSTPSMNFTPPRTSTVSATASRVMTHSLVTTLMSCTSSYAQWGAAASFGHSGQREVGA